MEIEIVIVAGKTMKKFSWKRLMCYLNSKQWIQSSEIKVKDFRWGNSYCIEKDEHRFLNPTKIFVLGKHEQTVQDLNPYFMKNCSFDTSLNNAISKIAIKEIFTLIWNGP